MDDSCAAQIKCSRWKLYSDNCSNLVVFVLPELNQVVSSEDGTLFWKDWMHVMSVTCQVLLIVWRRTFLRRSSPARSAEDTWPWRRSVGVPVIRTQPWGRDLWNDATNKTDVPKTLHTSALIKTCLEQRTPSIRHTEAKFHTKDCKSLFFHRSYSHFL